MNLSDGTDTKHKLRIVMDAHVVLNILDLHI